MLENNNLYPCTNCGACCQVIYQIPNVDKAMLNNDGSCKYLINNKCSIYENRPEFCNVNMMYEKYYKQDYTINEFYNLNIVICNELQDRMQVNDKFKIPLIQI